MSGDKFRKTQAGRPLEIPAPTWNAMVDAARAHAEGQLNQNSQPDNGFRQADIIKVRNHSGLDLDRFSVLGIDQPLISPVDNAREFKNQVAVRGVLPTTSHSGQFVVLLEPLKAGAIGRAWASGVFPARVRMAAAWHTHVDIESSNANELVSRPDGGAQILWRGVGTWDDDELWDDSQAWDSKTLWAIVRLSNIHRPHYVAKIPEGGIPARSGLQTGAASCELFTVGATGALSAVTDDGDAVSVTVRNYDQQAIEPPEDEPGYVGIVWDGRSSWLAHGSSPTSQFPGAATQGVVFSLTSALAPGYGNSATATVVDSGKPIIVTSTGPFQSFAGCLGLAIVIGGQYWIVHVNQYALLSRGMLTSDTHGLSASPGTVGDVADQEPITVGSLAPISGYPHSYIPSPLPAIANPFNLLGKSGDDVTVAYNRAASRWELFRVHPKTFRSFRFRLEEDFPGGTASSTSDYIIQNPAKGHEGGDPPDPLPALKDVYSLALGAKSGDTGLAVYDWKLGGWIIQSISHEATIFRGQLESDFSGTPATFTVTPVVEYNGHLPVGPVTVQNIYRWASGLAEGAVLVMWNPIDQQWEPAQMECS